MSVRDKMDTADIQPGATVKIDYFNLSSSGSIEYNVDQELMRRSEHAYSSFVVTIPTLFDNEFGGGYTASDSLKVTRNTSDNATIDIQAGNAYIGGRRYKQLSDITGLTVNGSPSTDDTYYVQLRYTKSTDTFDFYASTTEQADSSTVKYLTLGSATWSTTSSTWSTTFTDLRASNTSLPPPVTLTKNDSSNYILTVQNTNAALLGLYVDGYVKVGGTGDVRKIDLYGDNTTALTIHDGSSSNVTLVSDNTDRLKVLNNLYVPSSTQLGSMTFSSTTFSGCITFDCGASPSFTTSSGDFDWNSENFTSVGSIGCSSVDATGNIQGSQIISDVATGTAPLTVSSTTRVTSLNVDQVDGYDLDQSVSTTSTPTFSTVTLGTSSSITFDSSGTDPVISAKTAGGELYFGDAIKLADKETSPDWSITGAGVITGLRFTSTQSTGTAPFTVSSTTLVSNLNADLWDGNQFSAYLDQGVTTTDSPTFAQVTITSGPTVSGSGIVGSGGDNISGFSNISAATLTLSSNLTTSGTINGLSVSSGTINTGTWQGTVIDSAYLDSSFSCTTLTAGTSVAVTSGPTINASGITGATGDDITGFDSISAASLTLSGSITATTSGTING
ncbi:MAG: hypothetical protein GF411_02740, partial [Candidatus Lokiarchaeota archaeon]|nr:hypothetical protein [Candidatus Lokiarchaeota archaeon]